MSLVKLASRFRQELTKKLSQLGNLKVDAKTKLVNTISSAEYNAFNEAKSKLLSNPEWKRGFEQSRFGMSRAARQFSSDPLPRNAYRRELLAASIAGRPNVQADKAALRKVWDAREYASKARLSSLNGKSLANTKLDPGDIPAGTTGASILKLYPKK